MGYLTDDDYDDLPEDNGAAFSLLEGLSRSRPYEAGRDDRGDITFEDMLRYMNEVTALAKEFEFTAIDYDDQPDHYTHEFARFTRAVDATLAQIRVQRARRDRRNSVALSGNSREKMQHYLERLKEEIAASSLPKKRQTALLDKIIEFEAELTKPRLNLAIAMALVAMVTTTAHDGGELLTSAPSISKAFLEMIGKDKQDEADTQAALPRYVRPKQLQDQRPVAPKASTSTALTHTGSQTITTAKGGFGRGGSFGQVGGFSDDLDDDVPF
jgi:hypothetical protein